jgi:hypothetical protein
VPHDADDAAVEELRKLLEERIWACEEEANKLSGYVPKPEELRS